MDAESQWPPAPPEGYQQHDPEYEQPWYVTGFLFIWIVSVLVGVPALVIGVHGFDTAVRIVREVLQPDDAGEWTVYIAWTAATVGFFVGIHETLHALCGRCFGFRTTFHFEYNHPLSWSPSIVSYGGFQSRGESLAIVLAPLVILTPASILVLVVGQNVWVIATAAYIVLGNSAGAIGDLASAGVFWHLPDSELLYHDKEGRRQYYTPALVAAEHGDETAEQRHPANHEQDESAEE